MESNFWTNEVFVLMVVAISVMMGLALSVIILFMYSRQKLLRAANRENALLIRHQQDLIQNNLRAQEEERRRIARDLHDDIGSKLNVLHLSLTRLSRAGQNGHAGNLIAEMDQLVHTTIDTTRRISHDLLPPVLEEFGLAAALEELIEAYRRNGSLSVHEQIDPDAGKIPPEASLQLFRIIQELFKNAVQHGEAKNVYLSLTLSGDNRVRLLLTDDGKGFDPLAVKSKGLGLKNLDNRAALINGHLTMESRPGNGVRVSLEASLAG
jgi:two-component system, NarL family, sensor kinase